MWKAEFIVFWEERENSSQNCMKVVCRLESIFQKYPDEAETYIIWITVKNTFIC